MNKFLAIIALLFAFGEAQAHSHPGIDSLTHSLEHLAANYQADLSTISGLGLVLVSGFACLVWHHRRPQ